MTGSARQRNTEFGATFPGTSLFPGMFTQRSMATAAILALAAALPSRAGAECTPGCDELPAMQKALFQQEFLQERFQKYVTYDIVPSPELVVNPATGQKELETMIDAMQREGAQALQRCMKSPAGGGVEGTAAAGAGTTARCTIVVTENGKSVPLVEAKYRKTHRCWDADYTLDHERQHVADCEKGHKITEEYLTYAASDVRAYGVGIRVLRRHIAATARRCGWKGSARDDGTENATRKNPVDDQEQPVVPTPAQVQQIVDALKTTRGKK
jgi:hypothetical protein